jgi:hypothetical protein
MDNRILKLMDTDLIIKMCFFVGDLHRQIEQLRAARNPDLVR